MYPNSWGRKKKKQLFFCCFVYLCIFAPKLILYFKSLQLLIIMKRKITKIIIHCTATPACRDYSVEDIRHWHLKRGFSDIGYHYVIDCAGITFEGRSIDMIGAHCKGHNAHSIGVCYVGGLDYNGKPCDTRTSAQIDSLHRLVSDLVHTFGPLKVYGHNEFSNKACPCFDVKSEFDYINNPLFDTLKL